MLRNAPCGLAHECTAKHSARTDKVASLLFVSFFLKRKELRSVCLRSRGSGYRTLHPFHFSKQATFPFFPRKMLGVGRLVLWDLALQEKKKMVPAFVRSGVVWSVGRSVPKNSYIVCLRPGVPGVAQWLGAAGCVALRPAAYVPGEGVALWLQVPPLLLPWFKRLPSGGRGSNHPANRLFQ